jgi:hypothetical protein
MVGIEECKQNYYLCKPIKYVFFLSFSDNEMNNPSELNTEYQNAFVRTVNVRMLLEIEKDAIIRVVQKLETMVGSNDLSRVPVVEEAIRCSQQFLEMSPNSDGLCSWVEVDHQNRLRRTGGNLTTRDKVIIAYDKALAACDIAKVAFFLKQDIPGNCIVGYVVIIYIKRAALGNF